jgi:hypothetical protein
VSEHEFEPVRGLPEPLPPGESILWQGGPRFASLARRAFHAVPIAAYFGVLLAWRAVHAAQAGETWTQAAVPMALLALLAAVALGLLAVLAWFAASTAVYTITDKRVVMRVGIVLTLTFNIPYTRITAAGLRLEADGTGDLPLTLSGEDRIAWLHLWPHARPWRLAQPEPMLRSVPHAADVARVLCDAWSRRTGLAAGASTPAEPVPAQGQGNGRPALSGR